ncbi:MAG: T9SS type A sorting domain-containing protein [Aliifodinibius sp.]|nr:T9SS type A sorting domain-containing protein [Fodinibius sp.]NIV14588.1 T9SS type A sorting domain-containing protein [Fodinibius sp.]NIY28441.1 T9SS type A sorting domain-containing protein [Fodinibius sp.]
MLEPPDSTIVYNKSIQFKWSKSNDCACDTLTYFLHLFNTGSKDTTISSIIDTAFIFNGESWLESDSSLYNWEVITTDNIDFVKNLGSALSFIFVDSLATDILEITDTQFHFDLKQNYPNPFNPTTKIKFSLPRSSYVHLSVYNLIGREVAKLISSNLKAGIHEVTFNGTELSSGVYFYSLRSQGFTATRKLLLIK